MSTVSMGSEFYHLDMDRRAKLEALLSAPPPSNAPYVICALAIVLANIVVMGMMYSSLQNQDLMLNNQQEGKDRGIQILNNQAIIRDTLGIVSGILHSRSECK